MVIETANFAPVPKINAANDPNATLNALPTFRLSYISSPTNAPTNGNNIIPHGGKTKIPTTNPTVEPVVAAREPPNSFVIHTGMK